MTLKALHPNQSEQDIVPRILESETTDIECDSTNISPPPQAETVERGTGFSMTANLVSNTTTMYRYSPLPANFIRLLRLQPHSDEHALVHCQLFEYPLLDSSRGTHLYEALSYVWGSEEKPRRVLTNKGDLYVTENLHAALLRLRDCSFERIIWADAICINQDDIEERNHQAQAMAMLQEVAAARQVLMMFHSMDMDGFAFCTGLTALNNDFKDPDAQNRIRSAAYLIKGAGLRPKHLATFSDRFSLKICPLGERVDMYHTRKAKDLRDKIYALLGMSSDALSGLLLNYNMLWRDLFRQLVHFLVGEQALVETWDDQQVAVIKHTGCVLGKVVSVSSAGARDERQSMNGDVVCLLQGASKPTIIRPYEDYCVVVAIAVTPIGDKQIEGAPFDWRDCSRRIQALNREMLLVWDWETRCEEYSEIDYECFLESREFMHAKTQKGKDDRWGKVARLRLFLDWRGDQVPDNEEALRTAAGNPHQGKEILDLLLSRRGDQISISKGMVKAAAKNYGQGREVIKLLLDRRGDQVPITEEVLKIAAGNHYHGKQVIELLLSRRGNQVPITAEVLEQAARNHYQAKEIIELLLGQREDQVPITEEVLKLAAEIIKQGREVIILLLDRFKGQIPFTEEVIKTVTETWGQEGAIVRQLRYYYKI
ncbi:hypothetical protein MKX08_008122 [Trichoderma sp. CBMAI-0020]|nr:hypothetical protein MKX08_008122 [Trichoderma sp. CBMAI-0020]